MECAAGVNNCIDGGLIGIASNAVILDAWSSAAVDGGYGPAGLVGASFGNTIVRNSYATGDVTCVSNCIAAGGFTVQMSTNDVVLDSFATGKVQCPTCTAGGFVGLLGNATVTNVYATGAVIGGTGAFVGGLIGRHSGTAIHSFAAGVVLGGAGATLGGLIGTTSGTPAVFACYWDTTTSGQMTSAGGFGTAQTTTQLRAALPAGFTSSAWGITKTLSYPYLNTDGFSSNLATLVRASKIYTALPIGQSDKSQYIGNPKHVHGAALATVYTMVARAIGQTLGIGQLDDVKIDRYFWLDATQATIFRGPVKQHATLGAMTPIAPATPLKPANVIGKLNQGNWVVLRGSYTKPGGGLGTHYMLATLYTRTGAGVTFVIANDPATGEQVAIDPVTKRVVLPPRYPLAGFKVTGYAVISNIH